MIFFHHSSAFLYKLNPVGLINIPQGMQHKKSID